MKKEQKSGFVLLLVITIMSLIGAEMFVLTGNSNTIMFQSETAYLNACERNLIACGLAWAEQNIKNQSPENFNRTIELDVANMDIRNSTLAVVMGVPTDKEAEIRINTSCSSRRQHRRHSNKYHITVDNSLW